MTRLDKAIRANDARQVRAALRGGADTTDSLGTAIREAERNPTKFDPEILRLLLGYENPNDDDILISAAAIEYEPLALELVAMLLEDGRDDPTKYDSAVLLAAQSPAVVELLLADGRARPSDESYHQATDPRILALYLAAEDDSAALNHLDLFEYYLADYEDLEPDVLTAFISLLLQDGRADPAANDNAAIETAAVLGFDDIVYLLYNDARVRAAGLPEPHVCCQDDEKACPRAVRGGCELQNALARIAYEELEKKQSMATFARRSRIWEPHLLPDIMAYATPMQLHRRRAR